MDAVCRVSWSHSPPAGVWFGPESTNGYRETGGLERLRRGSGARGCGRAVPSCLFYLCIRCCCSQRGAHGEGEEKKRREEPGGLGLGLGLELGLELELELVSGSLVYLVLQLTVMANC